MIDRKKVEERVDKLNSAREYGESYAEKLRECLSEFMGEPIVNPGFYYFFLPKIRRKIYSYECDNMDFYFSLYTEKNQIIMYFGYRSIEYSFRLILGKYNKFGILTEIVNVRIPVIDVQSVIFNLEDIEHSYKKYQESLNKVKNEDGHEQWNWRNFLIEDS